MLAWRYSKRRKEGLNPVADFFVPCRWCWETGSLFIYLLNHNYLGWLKVFSVLGLKYCNYLNFFLLFSLVIESKRTTRLKGDTSERRDIKIINGVSQVRQYRDAVGILGKETLYTCTFKIIQTYI